MHYRKLAAAAAALLLAALSGSALARQDASEDERPWQRRWEQQERYRAAAQRPAVAALGRFTGATLTRFRDEAEFDAYVRAVRAAELEDRKIEEEARRLFASAGPIRFAQARAGAPPVATDATQQTVCDPAVETCEERSDNVRITVTGSRIAVRNASITNNQMRGVDEGDIVKQIGRYLLVLSDGRIFVIDTRPGGRPGLVLVERVDVYRDANADSWIDELLVYEDRVLVAGYSEEWGETELSVFRLRPEGQLVREGVFTRRSNDYYSIANYATRIVGDSLVLYSIFDISALGDEGTFSLASMQRWSREPENRPRRPPRGRWNDDQPAPAPPGPRLLDADAIYRPVRTEREPTIHAISICPLTQDAARAPALDCRSTAFVGSEAVEWYVTADETVLWTRQAETFGSEDCPGPQPPMDRVVPALLFRIPHDGAAPGVAGARGEPFDQFSMQVNDGRLRALVDRKATCDRDLFYAEPMYVETLLSAFRPTLRELGSEAYADVPNPRMRWIANRFTERHLVYGGLSQYRSGVPNIDWDDYEDDDPDVREWRRRERSAPPAYVVPAGRPADVSRLDIGHTVIRAERYGESDVVLSGYRDRRGLSLSLIDLDGRPRIGSAIKLDGRFESEGRSHAFNSLVQPDGSGMIGLPTTPRRSDSRRSPARSRASDVSFLSVGPGHALGELGELTSNLLYAEGTYNEETGEEVNQDGLEGYECEVSCIDWYGNSRPIFTDGRIFALTGGELVEGRLFGEQMIEVRRIDFLRARPRRR